MPTQSKEQEHKVGYVGRRVSSKQAKLFLTGIPKHGAISRRTAKFYLGLTDSPPGPAIQPNSKQKDKK